MEHLSFTYPYIAKDLPKRGVSYMDNKHGWLCLTCDGVEEVSSTVSMIYHRHNDSLTMLSPMAEVQYREYKAKVLTKVSKQSPKGRRVFVEIGKEEGGDTKQ